MATTEPIIVSNPEVPIISDDVYETVKEVLTISYSFLSAWALFSSIINIITFSMMGPKDGITQNFLILSASDGVLSALQVATDINILLNLFGPNIQAKSNIYMPCISQLWRFASYYPLNLSLITVTVIAVVRCLCVTMPFTVGSVVTARRQLVAILTLSLLSVLPYAVMIYHYRLAWVFTPRFNRTLINQVPSSEYYSSREFADNFRNALFYICLAIMVVSVAVLITTLQKSARFRELAAGSKPQQPVTKEELVADASKTKEGIKKEVQIAKNVIFVLVVFIAGNFPFVLQAILRLAIPDFEFSVRYDNLDSFFQRVTALGIRVSIGCNIFVYFSYNRKYRGQVKALFRLSSSSN